MFPIRHSLLAEKYGKNHLLNKIVHIETMNEADQIKQLEYRVSQLQGTVADTHIDQKLAESYFKLVLCQC